MGVPTEGSRSLLPVCETQRLSKNHSPLWRLKRTRETIVKQCGSLRSAREATASVVRLNREPITDDCVEIVEYHREASSRAVPRVEVFLVRWARRKFKRLRWRQIAEPGSRPKASTGWTECAPLPVREQKLLSEVLTELRKLLPSNLLGLDTDNDSVFMNETVRDYC
jgi:hypothetical protein